ncbi:hypothetical protein ACTWPB_14315 [Nocardia sp. IBHARD005]|uniref:hypothetical protein n=1 Tax=Nocardia sp. IBHARD005 TaxID=3457765 RepID=UPI004059FD08
MSNRPIQNPYRTATSACLSVAGVALAAYPMIRPYSDEKTLAGAAAYASTSWVLAHLLAVLGFALIVGAMLFDVASRPATRSGLRVAATATGIVAVTLLTLYYGFECFALNEIGRAALDADSDAGMALADTIRNHPAAVTLFGLGWLALGVSVTLWAVALRSGWAPAMFAVMVWLYLPQFFLPPAGRIGHGLLVMGTAFATAWVVRTVRKSSPMAPNTSSELRV